MSHECPQRACLVRIARGAEQTREGKQRPGRQHQACVTPQRVFRSGHISTRPSVQCAGNNSWQGANDTREGKKPAEPPVRTLTIQPIALIQQRDENPKPAGKVTQRGLHRPPAQRHATHQCNRANARQPTPPTASNACSTTTTLGCALTRRRKNREKEKTPTP